MSNNLAKIIVIGILVVVLIPIIIIGYGIVKGIIEDGALKAYEKFEANINIVSEKVQTIKANNEQYLGDNLGESNNIEKYNNAIQEIIDLYGIDITDNEYYYLSNNDKIAMGISSLEDPYVVNYENGLVFDLKPIVYLDVKYYTSSVAYRTFNKMFAYDLPYIPTGFKYLEGNWNDGYVITDNYQNEFVWIPVGTINKENPADAFKLYYATTTTKNTIKTVKSEIYNEIIKSINKYGGFYIARYEMSLQGATENNSAGTKDILQSKRGVLPVTQISYSTKNDTTTLVKGYNEEGKSVISVDAKGALELANKMADDYNWVEYGVHSTIMYGEHYDTAIYVANEMGAFNNKKVGESSAIITDSSNAGNYYNSIFKYLKDGLLVDKIENKGKLLPTGTVMYSTNMNAIGNMNNLFNIYDLCGNVAEWIIQGKEDEYRYTRGGSYASTGYDTNISQYTKDNENFASASIGLRVVLYLD